MKREWVLLPIICFFRTVFLCTADNEPSEKKVVTCAELNLRYEHRLHGESFVRICDPHITSLQGLRCVERGESRRTLFIAKTGIKKIPARAFEHAGNPHKLAFSGHSIEEIDDDAFVGLTNLRHLILTRNHISTITPDILAPCKNLEEVNLCENPIPSDQIDALRAALPHVTIKASEQPIADKR